jgi:hypothetical protein
MTVSSSIFYGRRALVNKYPVCYLAALVGSPEMMLTPFAKAFQILPERSSLAIIPVYKTINRLGRYGCSLFFQFCSPGNYMRSPIFFKSFLNQFYHIRIIKNWMPLLATFPPLKLLLGIGSLISIPGMRIPFELSADGRFAYYSSLGVPFVKDVSYLKVTP